jgi:hypothetical protein
MFLIVACSCRIGYEGNQSERKCWDAFKIGISGPVGWRSFLNACGNVEVKQNWLLHKNTSAAKLGTVLFVFKNAGVNGSATTTN